MKATSKFWASSLALLGLLIAACVSIPHQELNTYVDSYATARSTSEDIILSTKLTAKAVANVPREDKTSEEQQTELGKRLAALDARLEALQVVSQYNDILVKLSTGTKPADVQADLEGFADALDSFGASQLTQLVGSGNPLGGVISMAVSVIDNWIQKKKFAKAAAEGQAPVVGIIEVLLEDADDIHTIEAQWLELEADGHRKKADALSRQFRKLLNEFLKSDKMDEIVTKFDAVYANSKFKTKPTVSHQPTEGAKVLDAANIEVLRLMITEIETAAAAYAELRARIEAHRRLINEYKKTLSATASALVAINRAITNNRRAGGLELVTDVFALRSAYLEYQEVRNP